MDEVGQEAAECGTGVSGVRKCSGCRGENAIFEDLNGNNWCDKCCRPSDKNILADKLKVAYNSGVEAAAVLMQSKYAGCMDEDAIRGLKMQ